MTGPLQVASSGVQPGHGDLRTLVDIFLGKSEYPRLALGLFLMAGNVGGVWWWLRGSTDPLFALAVSATSSLLVVTHLDYDYVFLLPAVVFLLFRGTAIGLLGIVATGYCWQLLKILHVFGISSSIGSPILAVAVQCLAHGLVLYCVLRLRDLPDCPLLRLAINVASSEPGR